MPAAYLTGFLLGKSKQIKSKELIFDTGLNSKVAGSRIFAVLKGAVDAGLHIPHKKEILPTDERLNSNEKFKDALKIKEKL